MALGCNPIKNIVLLYIIYIDELFFERSSAMGDTVGSLPRPQFCGAVGVYYEGLAVWEEDGKYFFHVRPDETPAYPQLYRHAEYFQNGLAWVQKQDGTWVRINKDGEEVKMRNTNDPT